MNVESLMNRALELGEKGRISAPPNPWVGCVIAKEGRIIGEGFHHRPGTPHAEVMALRQAGEDAKGASAFVSLEPCCHFGRTSPCVDALIKAGIAHAYVALEDPDPRVSQKGIEALKRAGIKVSIGIEKEAASGSLRSYLHQRKTGRAFCLVKAAMSIDGKTAAKDRSSQWITGSSARIDAHRLRAESQAILVGSGTARDDRPRLNVRMADTIPLKPPIRVILDSSGSTPAEGPLFDTKIAETLILTSPSCPQSDAWKQAGVEVQEIPSTRDLTHVLELLGKRGILQVMVEGGATLQGSFLKQGLIDELVIYVGPCVLGDEGYPLFRGLSIHSMEEAIPLKIIETKPIDDCIRIRYQGVTQ